MPHACKAGIPLNSKVFKIVNFSFTFTVKLPRSRITGSYSKYILIRFFQWGHYIFYYDQLWALYLCKYLFLGRPPPVMSEAIPFLAMFRKSWSAENWTWGSYMQSLCWSDWAKSLTLQNLFIKYFFHFNYSSKWYLIKLVFFSLIVNNVKHLFMWLFGMFVSLVRCLFKSFANFKFLLSFYNALWVLSGDRYFT